MKTIKLGKIVVGTPPPYDIKIITDVDRTFLKRLFNSIDENTDNNYGRFDGVRFRGDEIADKIIQDKNEIGILAVGNEHYYSGPPMGYAHLYLSTKPSRRHSASFGVVVHQDYQGQGIGEALLKEAIKTAKENKIKKIWLHVYDYNKQAIKLYKKHGFKKEGVFR